MLITIILLCCLYEEAVGQILATSQAWDTSYSSPLHTQGLDTSYASSYHTQYDTFSDNMIYGDENYYYYDEPVTTNMFLKPNNDQLKFGLKSTPHFNEGGNKGADTIQSVKVKSSNLIGQNKEGYTRKHHRVDKSVSGSIDRTWYSGMVNLFNGAKTISGPVFHNTVDLFRNINKEFTLDQPEYRNINKERLREGIMVITDRNSIRDTSSTTKSPIEKWLLEKQPSSQDKLNIESTTLVPKGTGSTKKSPVVVDVSELPANQKVRQEILQESELTTSTRQNATDQDENVSPNRRLGTRITPQGRSYVRGLMMSVLRRVDTFSDGNERRPVRI